MKNFKIMSEPVQICLILFSKKHLEQLKFKMHLNPKYSLKSRMHFMHPASFKLPFQFSLISLVGSI